MTISNFRASEPLYIVMVRQDDAERLLRQWAQINQCQVTIEGNRMKMFEHRSLSLFQVTWPHATDKVMIWDTWNKRHLYIE